MLLKLLFAVNLSFSVFFVNDVLRKINSFVKLDEYFIPQIFFFIFVRGSFFLALITSVKLTFAAGHGLSLT